MPTGKERGPWLSPLDMQQNWNMIEKASRFLSPSRCITTKVKRKRSWGSKKYASKKRKTEIKRIAEVPVKCCRIVVIQQRLLSLRFCSKSELLSPPVAPVGSRHASRHQATVMERRKKREERKSTENEQRSGGGGQ